MNKFTWNIELSRKAKMNTLIKVAIDREANM